jgi:SAM-dependent methyltransferase
MTAMFRHGRARDDGDGTYRLTRSTRRRIGAILRCRSCGLGMLPPPTGMATRYAEGADPLCAAQADVRIRNARTILQQLPPPIDGAQLLDVGAGYGFLLEAARALGYSPIGVEPSRAAAEFARRTYGLDVRCEAVEETRFAPASFDVVTMTDVVEHLADPAAELGRIHQWLRPGGRLLVLTPDIGSPIARALGRLWWGLHDDHYFYLSRASLARLLSERGFRVERIRSCGRSFPLSHWIFKLTAYHEGLARALAGVTRALRLASAEIAVNLGDQMVCVAQRP